MPFFQFSFPSRPRAFHAKRINKKNCALLSHCHGFASHNDKTPHLTPISSVTMAKHHCSCQFRRRNACKKGPKL